MHFSKNRHYPLFLNRCRSEWIWQLEETSLFTPGLFATICNILCSHMWTIEHVGLCCWWWGWGNVLTFVKKLAGVLKSNLDMCFASWHRTRERGSVLLFIRGLDNLHMQKLACALESNLKTRAHMRLCCYCYCGGKGGWTMFTYKNNGALNSHLKTCAHMCLCWYCCCEGVCVCVSGSGQCSHIKTMVLWNQI